MTTSNEKLSQLDQDNSKFWSKPINKIIWKLVLLELVFIIVLKILVSKIYHEEHEVIYYVNINFLYLISIISWISFKHSKVNKIITALIAGWFSFSVPYAVFFIFSSMHFSENFNYINFHVLYIFSSTYNLFTTFYLFYFSLFPEKKSNKLLTISFFSSFIISGILYMPILISGEYRQSWDPLFTKSYLMNLINFSLLIIFWHQYTKMKIIFSEYLPNIISIYTVVIGLEIFHNFSSQNELLFHYFAQYFNSILWFLILGLFIARVNYLINPISVKNEKYIQNYFMLHGYMEKPRRGLFVEFYSSINRNAILIILAVLIFLGVYLFFFNRFKVFIRLNILILVLSAIISMILAILTWHTRWYNAIGIFFKRREK